MNKVRLIGTNINTSCLGFGCGQIMRVPSAKLRQRLLNEAYDSGIRHFDVARMYGLGAAEKELGKFARSKRDKLVIATKFGIDLSSLGGGTALVQGVARRLIGLFPALRKVARRGAGTLLQPRRYDSAKAQSSLETSLRELGTDYVDLFLLHEPTLESILNNDVLDFLEHAKSQGKIRAYGIAGLTNEVIAIYRKVPELAPLVQIPNDAVTRNIEKIVSDYGSAIITYSPFSSALKRIVDHVKSDSLTSRRWSTSVGKDCSLADNVAVMLLRYCLHVNSSGVVLFSTTKPERLRALARAVIEDVSNESSLQSFLRCIDEEIRTPNISQ